MINNRSHKAEKDTPYFFSYSATLRISGETLDVDEISKTLSLEPTHTHVKGELDLFNSPYDSDIWLYRVALPKEEELDKHLRTLWSLLSAYKDFLTEVKKKHKIDIFCGYQSNSSTAGFGLSPLALEMFIELQILLEISVIVSSNELHKVINNISK